VLGEKYLTKCHRIWLRRKVLFTIHHSHFSGCGLSSPDPRPSSLL